LAYHLFIMQMNETGMLAHLPNNLLALLVLIFDALYVRLRRMSPARELSASFRIGVLQPTAKAGRDNGWLV
jgi:hypothetical protein